MNVSVNSSHCPVYVTEYAFSYLGMLVCESYFHFLIQKYSVLASPGTKIPFILSRFYIKDVVCSQ